MPLSPISITSTDQGRGFMETINPALIERVWQAGRAAADAGHGRRQAVLEQEAAEIGISLPTLYRYLKSFSIPKERKQRTDAGTSCLSVDEARAISGYLMESRRANGKQLASIENAVEVLRSNGEITAARIDPDTGEMSLLSASTVSRALKAYGVHPEQLSQPSPKVRLRSEHPNHVWQIDPSLCVLYYLPKEQGLQVMSEKAFYKNKPANFAKIERERVWRYVITDHASGVIFVHYVLGAESGKNLVEAFIHATQKRHDQDPFHGLPRMVMVDPGSANTGAVFTNLCRSLGITVQVNQPGQPWAKGQVEKANDIVECDFEHRLRYMERPPRTVDEINNCAWAWMRYYNVTKVHSRTQETRYSSWLRIRPDQLQLAPSVQVMRELAIMRPETRVVSPHLTIQFKGHLFSVADVPDVMVGVKLQVTRNPWRDDDSAQVMFTNAEGREVVQVLEAEQVGEFGFPESAVAIGDYQRHKDTVADTERKGVERLLMDAPTDEAAQQARKEKRVAFSGRIDPMKPVTDTRLPGYLQKAGVPSTVTSPIVEIKPLTHVEAGKQLAQRLASGWRPEHFTWLKQQYPDGVPQEALPEVEQRLARGAGPLKLIAQ